MTADAPRTPAPVAEPLTGGTATPGAEPVPGDTATPVAEPVRGAMAASVVEVPGPGSGLGLAYDHLREQGPVHQVVLPDGSLAWLVTGYQDVAEAFASPRLSLDKRHALGWSGFSLPPALDANLLNMDPPDHTRIRRLVGQAFTPARVASLRPHIQRVADTLLDSASLDSAPLDSTLLANALPCDAVPGDALPCHAVPGKAMPGDAMPGKAMPGDGLLHDAPSAPIDLVEDYAAPLAITVIADLLGIPAADRTDFRVWTNAMLASHPPDRQAAAAAVVSMNRYVIELVAGKRAAPGDDLISAMLAARDVDDRLTEDELTSLVFLVLFAGYENSINLIANTVLIHLTSTGAVPPADGTTVATVEGVMAATVEETRVATAVEEAMRLLPPAPVAIRRFPVEDVTIAGTTIPAGATVLLAIASANRDPSVFTDPATVDFDRGRNPHLSLGHGIHFCLGAPLARLEAQIAVETLLRRRPGLALASPAADLTWRPSFRTLGPLQLPVTW